MLLIKEDDGSIVGRLLLYKRLSTKQDSIPLQGMITVGGMRASKLTGLLGIIVGKSDRASRDVGVPIVSASKLEDWASEQAALLSNLNLDTAIQIDCAMFARACGGITSTLKIAYHKSIRVNYEQIKKIIKESTDDTFLIIEGPPLRTDGKNMIIILALIILKMFFW